MDIKARIEKLEKHTPPDAPVLPAFFIELCDESGVKKLVHGDFSPASQDDMLRVQEQGRRIMILHLAPGTEIKPPRKPTATM